MVTTAKRVDSVRTVDELHNLLVEVDVEGWFRRNGVAVVFAPGKHRDACPEKVAAADPSYLRWPSDRVLPDTRRLIQSALDGGAV